MVLKRGEICGEPCSRFESDVKMYGTQAAIVITIIIVAFENDVKMYDIRCSYNRLKLCVSLVKR